MKGVQRSAIVFIPLTAVSSLLWSTISPPQVTQALPSSAPLETAAEQTSELDVGTKIPVVLPGGNPDANLVMAVGESLETSFEVATDVMNAQSQVVIPTGSTVAGAFEPEIINQRNGTRFRASRVTIGPQTFGLRATSSPFTAKRRNQLTVNDVAGGVSTIAAATVLDSVFNRIGGAAGVDSRILGGVKRGLGVGVLPTVLKTGQKLTQKATSQGEVIVVEPDQLGLLLDAAFQLDPTTVAQPAAAAPVNSALFIASGTRLSLGAGTPGTRYIVRSDESFPLKLQVASDVLNRQNQVVIPKGSLIKGRLTPAGSGSIFKASQVVMGGQAYALDAQTPAIAPTDVKEIDPSDLQGNTVTSSKASSVLSKVRSGNSGSSGGILGQLLGTGNGNEVIIFDPSTTQLELLSDVSLGTEG